MRSQRVILSCVVLSLLAVAYLPLGGAVTCEEDPTAVDCVNCVDTPDDPECTATVTEAPTEAPAEETTAAGEETTAPTVDTETTTAASTGGKGKKKKITRKFKIVRKPGKKTIRRRRNGKGKGKFFTKRSNNPVERRSGRLGGRRGGFMF